MKYAYLKKIDLSFDEVLKKTKEVLAADGFGVLTEIDVRSTMKKKLGVEYENYIILGVCNPPFAHDVLQIDKEAGLLLPCNVIVFEDTGQVYVSALLPTVAIGIVENTALITIAEAVEEKLITAINEIK